MSKFNLLESNKEKWVCFRFAKTCGITGIALVFCLISYNAKAQAKYMERGMNIHYFDIPSNSDSALFEGVKVKAFENRTQAVAYFRNMSLKRDMISVVVDSAAIISTKPELITIKEKLE